MALIDDFIAALGPMPERAMTYFLPYIRKMVNQDEMQLVVTLKKEDHASRTVAHVAERMHLSHKEASDLLEKSLLRGLVVKSIAQGETAYSATSFFDFLGTFATYEKGWDAFPLYIRRALSEWRYGQRQRDKWPRRIEQLEKGEPIRAEQHDLYLHDDEILLLDEVLEMIDAANDFAVTPCACRRWEFKCDSPVETCIKLNETAKESVAKGYGKRLTKDETKELVKKLDRKGLIHSGKHNWKTLKTTSFCNCCMCCCYPHRGGVESGLKGIWPRSFHIAVYDPDQCEYCGTCVKRCPLGAWEFENTTVEIDGVKKKKVVFYPERCWGCGLCANTCPPHAITMKALDLSTRPLVMRAEEPSAQS